MTTRFYYFFGIQASKLEEKLQEDDQGQTSFKTAQSTSEGWLKQTGIWGQECVESNQQLASWAEVTTNLQQNHNNRTTVLRCGTID